MRLKVKRSLKMELILSYLLIVFLMNSIAITCFFSLRTYLQKEDQMIERTIVANQIIISTQNINSIINGNLLATMPDYGENKEKVFKEVENIKRQVEILKKVIIDTRALKRQDDVKFLIVYYESVLKNIFETSENYKLAQTVAQKQEASRVAIWMRDTVQQLISYELDYQQTVKNKLNKAANSIGLWVCGLIILISLLSIGFAVIYSNRVGGDISRLALKARRFADGNLEVDKFVVKSKNEVFVLAESFTYMVTEIKQLIYDIEQKALVENRLKEQELKNLEYSKLLNEAELRFLQMQINPHFLFNTMNTIAAMAKVQKANDIKKMIESITDILRYNLKKIDQFVSLKEEYEITKNYIFIQKMRFGDKIEYYLSVDEDALDVKVPSMILQPFVENAITHGLEPKEENGWIALKIFQEDESVIVSIKDNGVGMPEEVLNEIKYNKGSVSSYKNNGIGVHNVIKRLELTYGRNVVYVDSKLGSGTEVKIELNKNIKDNL